MSKRDDVLGMPYGTAMARLRKQLMFELIQQVGADSCYRCGEDIKCVSELSVDHKVPWRGEDSDLFWDTNNIAYSHVSCNSGHKRHAGQHGRAEDKIRYVAGVKQKWCPTCSTWRHFENDFWANPSECKQCKNARNNEWRYKTGRRSRRSL